MKNKWSIINWLGLFRADVRSREDGPVYLAICLSIWLCPGMYGNVSGPAVGSAGNIRHLLTVCLTKVHTHRTRLGQLCGAGAPYFEKTALPGVELDMKGWLHFWGQSCPSLILCVRSIETQKLGLELPLHCKWRYFWPKAPLGSFS